MHARLAVLCIVYMLRFRAEVCGFIRWSFALDPYEGSWPQTRKVFRLWLLVSFSVYFFGKRCSSGSLKTKVSFASLHYLVHRDMLSVIVPCIL